jgi:hypothetical protein
MQATIATKNTAVPKNYASRFKSKIKQNQPVRDAT